MYLYLHRRVLTLIGGGFWQPDATTLAKLRRDIDRKPHKIKAVLTDSGIREAFLNSVKDDEKKAVKAFTGLPMNRSNALKRNPKVSLASSVFAMDISASIDGSTLTGHEECLWHFSISNFSHGQSRSPFGLATAIDAVGYCPRPEKHEHQT
jgi:hypothetical protein